MKKISATYLFFYSSFLIVLYVAVFQEKWLLVYVKPIVPVSLIVLYLSLVKKINILFPISMITILITDIFIYIDFIKYYTIIAVLISIFYINCVLLLRRFISKEDVKLDRVISPPVLISVTLIGYLIYSITELALPKVGDSVGAIVLIVISLLLFSGVCFFIYVADRFEKSIFLFIATCCTLFVDALLAINELYYYSRVFTVVINIAEIVGVYFFTSFFIETKLLDTKSTKEKYF